MIALLNKIADAGIALEIVDGKLKLFAGDVDIDSDLLNEIKSEKENITAYLVETGSLKGKDTNKNTIPKLEEQESYAVSSGQLRLWVLSQFDEGSEAYNTLHTVSLNGQYDITLFEKAIALAIDRHEILRTVFKKNNAGEVRQYIIPQDVFDFNITYLDFREDADKAEKISAYIDKDLYQPFDLERGPLLRACLFQLAEDQYVFYYNMHHIISDAWSRNVLSKDVLTFYESLKQGTTPSLAPLKIQYKDYAGWQLAQLEEASSIEHKEYWLKVLSGELPVLDLPGQKLRPAVKTHKGQGLKTYLSKDISRRLKNFSQEQKGSLFISLLSVCNVLFSKYSSEQDFIIGTTVSGREHSDLLDQIGFYVNALVLRNEINPTDSFKSLYAKIKENTLLAYNHQMYPFDRLLEDLNISRDIARNAIFDVSIVFQNAGSEITDFSPSEDIVNSFKDLGNTLSKFDVEFTFQEEGDYISFQIIYNNDVYEKGMIERLMRHFKKLSSNLLSTPDLSINKINYLTEEEEQQILVDFNNTTTDYPKEKTVIELFEEQVKATPDNIALIFEKRELTYSELDTEATSLANFLLENVEIEVENLIGIKLPKSEWSIISILAILKTGAAYVPIDLEYPKQRIDFIESDSDCKIIIDEDLLNIYEYSERNVAAISRPKITSKNLAYVMYTSGSTGKPKGVMIEQKGVTRLVKSSNYYQFSKEDVLLSTGSFSFDATTFEYWGTLLNGGQLILCSKAVLLDSAKLEHEIVGRGVNVMWFTAGWFNQLVDLNITLFSHLKTVVAGGDRLSPPHIHRLRSAYKDLEIINGYGPTENTTFSLTYNLKEVSGDIPIGYPISNSTVYILDDNNALCPVGVVGEICLGGDGLSRGYWKRPELTAEKFIPNPFEESTFLYKTGDLGKFTADGKVEFMGRKDDQVKIRGYRIELGEIESQLQNKEDIRNAVVLVEEKESGRKDLVAYLLSEEAQSATGLRTYLSEFLPSHMIPAYFIQVEEIPLTKNGKVDRRLLKELGGIELLSEATYVAPETAEEKTLVSIWKEVLDVDQVGVQDNFFELGGNSLMVVQVVNSVQKQLGKVISIQDFFSNPTIADLVKTEFKEEGYTAIPRASHAPSYPLSASQNRLWILSQLEGGSLAYNMPMALRFTGAVNEDVLEISLRQLIQRHEILRTSFKVDEHGTIRQYILPIEQLDFQLAKVDYSKKRNKPLAIKQYIESKKNEAFDLTQAPLLRTSLIKSSQAESIFFATMHHLIGDGWSWEILIAELVTIYNALNSDEPVKLPALNIQYKDYAVWLGEDLQAEKQKASEKYWLEQFSGELPVLDLPSYKTRPLIQTYNGTIINHRFSSDFLNRLKAFSQTHDATLFMTLMAGVNALLYRYTNQEDIIIGTPIAGREHPDLENQIGLYLNTLAIRTKIEKGQSFEELLAREKTTLLSAYEHQDYPFDELVGKLNLKRDTSRSALFDVMVILQNQTQLKNVNTAGSLSGLEVDFYEIENKKTHFDLSLIFREGEELMLSAMFNTDIYDTEWMENMLVHLEQFLSNVLEQSQTDIQKIHYLSEAEQQELLVNFNNTEAKYPEKKTIVDLIEEQVERSPKANAVYNEATILTYGELNEKSNQLAHYLLQNYSVKPEELIGVKLDRDEYLLITLIAILKTGGAYVPIDPLYPPQRISYIENDSQCKLTIDENLLATFKKEKEKYSTKNPAIKIAPPSLAYVIYTSGSTGEPKGVMLEHGSVVAMLSWAKTEYQSTDFDLLYAGTSYCFDLSVYEFFYPLSIGKPLRIIKNGLEIEKYLKTENKVLINTVPSVIQSLSEKGFNFKRATAINMAGEPVPVSLSHRLNLDEIEVRNLYGPSEDTTYSSCYRIEESFDRSIPIGKPLSNTNFYILSDKWQLQPKGVAGELYISGKGLSRGYLNRPELTSEKFIPNPFEKGTLMYKTGDLARWLPDGNMEFIGRKDRQVKVRGYRIELGEIDHAIQQLGIKQVVSEVKELNGEKVIAAYLVVEEELDKEKIRESLKESLPAFMIPGYFVELDAIPLTPNGKVDRKALPEVGGTDLIRKTYVAPSNTTEAKLVDIWQKILGHERIGVTDDFFELGGHSLLLTKLLNEYQKAFNKSIELKNLYNDTDLKSHARLLTDSTQEVFEIEKLEEQSYYSLSPSQLRFWLIYKIRGKSTEFNMPMELAMPDGFDTLAFERAFNELIKRHEILRTEFVEINGEARQRILPRTPIEIPYYRSRAEAVTEVFKHQFDLDAYPLFKVGLLNEETTYRLFFNIHHSISDGWSLDIISRDLVEIYTAETTKATANLPELSIHYKDYAQWQNGLLQSNEATLLQAYWTQQLSGHLPYLELPSDHKPPLKISKTAASYTVYISAEQKHKLDAISNRKGISTFAVFAAMLKILLYRLTSEKDITIGIPAANRNHYQLKDLVGCFINTLMLRDTINENESFRFLLEQVARTLVDALIHQNYPFEQLLNELKIQQEDNRFPISPVFLNMLDFKANTVEKIDDFTPVYGTMNTPPKFDLECYVKTFANGFSLNWVYNQSLFKKETIAYWVDAYLNIIDQVVKDADRPIHTLKIFETNLPEKEGARPTNDFEYFEKEEIQQGIAQRFEKQVLRFPKRTAVYADGLSLSYEKLNNAANHLARQISETTGHGTERIALLLKHNESCVTGMLGALKSGYAYVPIDYNNPVNRIQFILEDSNSNVIICSEETLETVRQLQKALPNLKEVVLSADYDHLKTLPNPEKITDPLQEAYVLYTSGSTGKPKGVVQNQRNVLHYISVYTNNVHISKEDNLSVFSTYTFDASVKDFYGAILNGGTVSVYNIVENGVHHLSTWLSEQKVTIIHMVPTIYRHFVKALKENEVLSTVRLLDLGGEACYKSDLDHFKKHFTKQAFIVNDYGPTEATIVSQKFLNHDSEIFGNNLSLGQPVVETEVFLLDENNQRKGVYEEGEIVFRSDYLSLGYLNQKELTGHVFITNLFGEGKRIYKSGDIGRMLPSGEIEFLHRKDSQVKINGLRIELAEIEHQLSQLENVDEAVVLVKVLKENKYLTAYIRSATNLSPDDIKTSLKNDIPKYMIPAIYIFMDTFPLTRTGKIDRQAFPEPDLSDLPITVYKAPETEEEKILVSIWEEVLGIEKVGVLDNFFDLGGHSLMIGQVINRMQKKLGKVISFQDFFTNPTIENVTCQFITKDYTAIPQAPAALSYPVTAAQNRLWILSQLEGGSLASNMPVAIRLKGAIDEDLFEEAFRQLIQRHEILRTSFNVDANKEIRQFITPVNQLAFSLERENFSRKRNKNIAVDEYIREKTQETFDLSKAPLLRGSLIKINKSETIFFATMHHLAGDGWSMEILVSELVKIYNSLHQGISMDLPDLNIQYKDYAVWQKEKLQVEKQKDSEKFWLDQFSGEIPVLQLPAFKPRPLIFTYNGASVTHTYSDDLLNKLNAFSKKQGATLFMTLMAGVNALLHRYTNQTDIIIGTPIGGRDHPDLENQIGLYLNTLAIRTPLEKGQNFENLLAVEKAILTGAYEHQNYPFDELVGKLNLVRDRSRSPLYDVVLVLQNQRQLKNINSRELLSGLEVSGYGLENKSTQVDIRMAFVEGNGLQLRVDYNTDIYEESFVQGLILHFESLMVKMIEQPEAKIDAIEYLTKEERNNLIADFNNTPFDYPKGKTLVDLFENQLAKTPDNIAVVFEDKQVSYKELDLLSDNLAFTLKEDYDIQIGGFIGVQLNRSEWFIISILGIMKAGAVYIPIDPELPADRKAFIFKDADLKLLITETSYIFDLDFYDGNVFSIDVEFDASVAVVYEKPKLSALDLAYVIYTSGSTGQPKGVMIEHSGIVNTILSQIDALGYRNFKNTIEFASFSFDASVWETFLALLSGVSLHVLNEETRKDVKLFENYILENKIEIATLPPAFLKLLDTNSLKKLKVLITAGEAAVADKVSEYLQYGTFYNAYGPTETSICATTFKIEKGKQLNFINIPIGKAIGNTQAYVLNESLRLCPPGISGELYIAGDGLAKGYLNRSDLTTERFIANPFIDGKRMYKTGDVCRWLPDGNLEYIGRTDDQVKIRGYRIELGEIESCLSNIQGVGHSVVLVDENENGKHLVAYYVANEVLDKSIIQSKLDEVLPDYMVPDYYVQLDFIPLTTNGKLDKQSLPAVSEEDLIKTEYIAPENDLEQQIVKIWQEVLSLEQVGMEDHFFDLGGHSVKAIQLVNAYYKHFKAKIKIQDIFNHPIARSHVELLNTATRSGFINIEKEAERKYYPLTAQQSQIWMASQMREGSLAFKMYKVLTFEKDFDVDKFTNAIHLVIKKYDILRTVFVNNEAGEISQQIIDHEAFDFSVTVKDISTAQESKKYIEDYLYKDIRKAFDLENGPLIRTCIFKTPEEKYVVYYNLHHIICDGWSLDILAKEVMQFYTLDKSQTKQDFPKLPFQYKDYALWEMKNQKSYFSEAENYWMKQLDGELPKLNLLIANKRLKTKTFEGRSEAVTLSKDVTEKLLETADKNNGTLYMTLLALTSILLYRYSYQQDQIIGTAMSGRLHPDLHHQIGCFVTAVPLRFNINKSEPVATFLKQIKKTVFEGREYQNYPFQKLVELLRIKRDPSRSLFFDVMVVMAHETDALQKTDRSMPLALDTNNSKYDLTFYFAKSNEKLHVSLAYNTLLFNQKIISKVIQEFVFLAEKLAGNADLTIEQLLTQLSPAEQNEYKDFLEEINYEISEDF